MMDNPNKIVVRRLNFFLNPSSENIMYSKIQKQSRGGGSVNNVFLKFLQIHRKHQCQSSLFNKVAGWPATSLKKGLQHNCFPANFVKHLRTPFYRTPLVAASENIESLCAVGVSLKNYFGDSTPALFLKAIIPDIPIMHLTNKYLFEKWSNSVRHRQPLRLKRNERSKKFLQNLNKILEKLLLY